MARVGLAWAPGEVLTLMTRIKSYKGLSLSTPSGCALKMETGSPNLPDPGQSTVAYVFVWTHPSPQHVPSLSVALCQASQRRAREPGLPGLHPQCCFLCGLVPPSPRCELAILLM